MIEYHIAFERLPWTEYSEGVRHKILDQQGVRIRLVEYSKSMPQHWCKRKHYGFLVEGHIEMDFKEKTEYFHPGDGIFIPGGTSHNHRTRIMTRKAVVFYIEDIPINGAVD
ncbi:cupin domain-containing protein [bacterium]|nr:cupin domain-containing protein [bacterium]